MIVEAVKGVTNFIGRLGENEARVMRFPIREMLNEFPGCTFTLANRRPNDADAYPSPNIAVNGDFLDWTVTSGDLTSVGFGECEVIASIDGKVMKSDIYQTVIKTALDDSGTVPEPWEGWVTSVTEAAEQAEAAVAHYPKIVDGYWYVWQDNAWVSTGEKAQGEQGEPGDPGDPGTPGQDGVSPTVDVEEITGGHRVTITDAEGDHAFDVMDGQSGGGGTSDYEDLSNKPQIGGVELVGNKSLSDLGAASASDVSAKYTKPGTGIPSSDMASAVQTSLGKADTAYQMPSGGIPASDIASGVIPDPTSIIDDTAGSGDTNKVWSADKSNELKSAINVLEPTASASDVGKVLKAKTVADGKVSEYEFGSLPSVPVTDVQVNGTSVLSSGVANVPVAGTNSYGVVKADSYYGVDLYPSGDNAGKMRITRAESSHIKAGTNAYKPITPLTQNESVFYGLAKAAGDTTQSSSSNAVGVYTETAKNKICNMIDTNRRMRLLKVIEVTEAVASVGFDVDSSGNPFAVDEIEVIGFIPKLTTGNNRTITYCIETTTATQTSGQWIAQCNDVGTASYATAIISNIKRYANQWISMHTFGSISNSTLSDFKVGGAINSQSQARKITFNGASWVRTNNPLYITKFSICLTTDVPADSYFEIYAHDYQG